MAENYDDISCEDVIYSEDYRDYIKEYFQDFSSIAGTYHPVCIEAIGSRYAVMHLAGDTSMQNILSDYNISMLPALYGLLGTAGLEESGISYFHVASKVLFNLPPKKTSSPTKSHNSLRITGSVATTFFDSSSEI